MFLELPGATSTHTNGQSITYPTSKGISATKEIDEVRLEEIIVTLPIPHALRMKHHPSVDGVIPKILQKTEQKGRKQKRKKHNVKIGKHGKSTDIR